MRGGVFRFIQLFSYQSKTLVGLKWQLVLLL